MGIKWKALLKVVAKAAATAALKKLKVPAPVVDVAVDAIVPDDKKDEQK